MASTRPEVVPTRCTITPTQFHGFGYLEDILDSANRPFVDGPHLERQIPDTKPKGLQPALGLAVNGQTAFDSGNLDENQRVNSYAVLSWQHTEGAVDWQTAVTGRYSSLSFTPDELGVLLFNGIAQNAYKRDVAFAWQADISHKINDAHTLRAGWYAQHGTATTDTTSQVLPVDSNGTHTSDVTLSIPDLVRKTSGSRARICRTSSRALRN